MSRRGLRVALCAAILLVGGGCVTFRGPEKLRRSFSASQNIQLEKCAGFSANTFGLLLSSMFAEVPGALWHLKWFEVGIYRMTGMPAEAQPQLDLSEFNLPPWQPFVFMQEDGLETRIVVQHNDTDIYALAAFILDQDELTVVHMTGNIDKLLESGAGREELLDTVDLLQGFLGHIERIRGALTQVGLTHQRHETRLRESLQNASRAHGSPPGDVPQAQGATGTASPGEVNKQVDSERHAPPEDRR